MNDVITANWLEKAKNKISDTAISTMAVPDMWRFGKLLIWKSRLWRADMLAHMKMQTTGELAEIIVTVPVEDALKIQKTVSVALSAAGHQVRQIDDEGEELFSVAEVLPERTPGMLVEGLRLKFEMTQEKLAELLGTKQNRVSDLENGRREVSKEMAKKLGEIFQVTYKIFL